MAPRVALSIVLAASVALGARANAASPSPASQGVPTAIVGAPVIRGVVTSSDGAPLIGATVMVRDLESPQTRTAITAVDGSFAFTDLFDGRFVLSAAKAGYVASSLGALAPLSPGAPINIRRGQAVEGVRIALSAGATISGRVFDETGRPAAGVVVSAIDRRAFAGLVTIGRAATATSDERGTYRIHSLAPGAYFVGAMPVSVPPGFPSGMVVTEGPGIQSTGPMVEQGGSRGTGHCGVYYPGTIDPEQAVAVVTALGEERRDVDFKLPQVRTGRVDGKVQHEDNSAVPAFQVLVTADRRNLSLGLGEPRVRTLSVQNGQFTVAGLQPGKYTVVARSSSRVVSPNVPPSNPAAVFDLVASANINASPELIWRPIMTLRRGAVASGRVVWSSGASAAATVDRTVLSLVPADPNASEGVPSQARVAPDGRFAFAGVLPGAYLVQASFLPPFNRSWSVASVVADGLDRRDAPLVVQGGPVGEIVVTIVDQVTELSGSLVDQAGQPVSAHYVVVFPADAALWVPRARWLPTPVRPATDGTFRLVGLPPGDYLMAATTSIDSATWPSVDVLRAVSVGAVPFTLRSGEKKVQNLLLR